MVLGAKEKEKLQGLLKRAIVQTCLENFSYRCEVDGLVCVTITMPGGSEDEVVVKMHEVLNGVSAHSYSSAQPSPYSKESQSSGLKTYLSSSHKELHANIHNLKYANDTKGAGGTHSNHHHHHNRSHPRNFSTGVQTTRTTSNNAYNHQQHGQVGEESDAPFICSLCLSNCTTYQELEKHFQDHHASNITHFCSSCNIGFESEADCSSHRLRVHPQNCSPEASDFVVSGGGDSNSGRSSAPTSRRKQSKPRKGVAEENLESSAAAEPGVVQEWNSLEESDDGSDMTALRIDMSKDALCENNNNDLNQRNHNEPGSLAIKELLDNSNSPRELTHYCCPQCRELFGSFSALEQHCYADHRLYVCSTCLLTFPQKVNRDRHVYIKHAGSKPFSCDVCGASFTRRDTLKKHKCKGGLNSSSFSPSSSRNSPLMACKSENDAVKMEVDGSECGLDLSHSSKNRSTNLENVDSKGSFYVENDYLDSGTPQGRSNQNSEDEEDQGGDGLPLALSMSIKESTASPYTALNKKYTCDRCSLVVMGGSVYIDHCKVIHRRTPCLHCGKTFSQKGNMERHKRQHTGERPFQCSECPSSYTRRETLKSHMSQAHGMQLQQQQPLRVHQQSLQVEQLQQQLFLAVAASGASSMNDTFPEEDDSPSTENLPEE